MNIMQSLRAFVLPLFLLSAGIACRNPAQKQDSKDVAEDKNDIKFDNKDQEKNASFTVDAVAGFNDMIHLSDLAVQQSANTGVKQLAAALKEEYTGLLDRFKAWGAKNNISLPAEATKQAREDAAMLAALPPRRFDKQWCELMMEKHKKMIGQYESATTGLPADSLREIVTAVLPPVRTQYDKLMQYHHKL
jgi:predicted outer membrane protein